MFTLVYNVHSSPKRSAVQLFKCKPTCNMSRKSVHILMHVFCTQHAHWYGSQCTTIYKHWYGSQCTRSECGGQSCSEALLSCCGGASGNLICTFTNSVNSHYGCQLEHCKPNYHGTSSSSGGGSPQMFWPLLVLTSQTSWILAHSAVVTYTPKWTPT